MSKSEKPKVKLSKKRLFKKIESNYQTALPLTAADPVVYRTLCGCWSKFFQCAKDHRYHNLIGAFRREADYEKMKVLMTDIFLPENTYTLELCEELKKHVELTLFCKKTAPQQTENIRWLKRFYGGGKNKLCAAAEYGIGLLSLAHELRNGKYDVVHVQMFRMERYEIPLYLHERRHYGILVHTVHNIMPHEKDERSRALHAQFYRACDLLIVHNAYCKNALAQSFGIPLSKIVIIPHGVYEKEKAVSSAQPPKEKDSGQTVFLQFGLLRRYKGVDILLKAIALIPEQERRNMHFIIAGNQYPNQDPTDYAKMIEELGVSDCTALRNSYIPQEELDGLFAKADVCLFPYREIYGSGSLLMAYSYGKPVIASDIPVFREETAEGQTGLLFAPEDPAALKYALISAAQWQPDTFEGYSRRINRLVSEKYNWHLSAQSLMEAYQSTWNGKRPRETTNIQF